MKSWNKKKLALLCGMLTLILGVSAVNGRLANLEELSVSAGYEEYELSQLEHDGEVLVDSINVTAVPGSSESVIVTSDNVAELENTDTYFDEVRASVTMDRNEIITMLTDVISELPEGSEKNNATQQKLKLIDYMTIENEVESLIENKGFSEALVIITDTSVNVSVKKQELSQADLAKIMDVVIRETGRSAEEIIIQSKF